MILQKIEATMIEKMIEIRFKLKLKDEERLLFLKLLVQFFEKKIDCFILRETENEISVIADFMQNGLSHKDFFSENSYDYEIFLNYIEDEKFLDFFKNKENGFIFYNFINDILENSIF